ncbi:hypothetical protein, partial [Enterococcus durans]|uniref:hypothetical protein n=1 Tax=Enterococcus durans TaxID=53345 RepID=UPI00195E2BC5
MNEHQISSMITSIIRNEKFLAKSFRYQKRMAKKGSILFDVGELRQHLFCIKKYRKDTLKSFRINL